jgi:CRISPR/Cas system-associated exonuclease Cas4 (RecB family)
MERLIDEELLDAGFQIVEHARGYEWKEYELRGYLDRKIVIDGRRIPLEYKAVSPYLFASINSIHDLLTSKKHWARMYPAQLLLYMMMSEEEHGVFYFKNALSFQPKDIWVHLWDHAEYVEEILQKLERVNEAVRTRKAPEPYTKDFDLCRECSFLHICTPDLKLPGGIEVLEDEEILNALEVRESLKQQYKQYKEVDEYVKKRLKGKGNCLIGDFYVEELKYTRNIPAREAKTEHCSRIVITKLPDNSGTT